MRISQHHQYCRYHQMAIKNPDVMQVAEFLQLGYKSDIAMIYFLNWILICWRNHKFRTRFRHHNILHRQVNSNAGFLRKQMISDPEIHMKNYSGIPRVMSPLTEQIES